MKKFFTMAALFAAGLLGFSSCSNEDGMFNEPTQALKPGEVAFSTGQLASKSGVTTTSLTDIYVKATTSTDEVFFDVEKFSYDGSVFRSVTNHYWPNNTADGANNSLNFYASNQQETITDANKVENYECDGEKDWVTATVKAGDKAIPYPLTFQHVFSQIKITAEAKDKTQDLVYKVVGIKLSAPNEGDYSFAATSGGVGTWDVDNSSSADYTYEQNMNGTFNPTAATEASQTWASTDYFNILPVTSGTMTFDVQYQVIQNGQVIGDFTGANSKQVTVDAPNLLSGKIYTYNFVLAINTNDVITFTMSMNNWDEGSTKNVQVPYVPPFFLKVTRSIDGNNPSSGTYNNFKVLGNFKGQIQAAEIGELCTSIDGSAFRVCKNLTSVIISNTVTSIGNQAFQHCSSLTAIGIPNSVTSIGGSCFDGCEALTSVNIPEGVTSIQIGTFLNCKNLPSITLPSSITEIGNQAFQECEKLTNINIPNGVTSIGSFCFEGCSALTTLSLPNSITSIGRDAFAETPITSFEIPAGVTRILMATFRDCASLTSITIPNSVTFIGNEAFYRCSSLTSINYGGTVQQWNAINKEPESDYYHAWNSKSAITVIHCADGDIEI